jgi:hypothetical protein
MGQVRRAPSRAKSLLRSALVAAGISGAAACAKDRNVELRELKEAACDCKSRACAAEVGSKLARFAVDSDLDEQQAKLAFEATTCLAALGE